MYLLPLYAPLSSLPSIRASEPVQKIRLFFVYLRDEPDLACRGRVLADGAVVGLA